MIKIILQITAIIVVLLLTGYVGYLIRHSKKFFFYQLNQLQTVFFRIYLTRDYFLNHLHYEKKIYFINKKLLISGQNSWPLYELVISLGQLRYRMQDVGTLEMMENELSAVHQALTVLFGSFGKKNTLSEKINDLENRYEGTVQSAAADPVIFLFFLKNLKEIDALCRQQK